MKKVVIFLFFGLFLWLVSCKTKQQQNGEETDTPSKGTINISVDESFKPVMEQQIKVFHSSFPDAHILATYKSEVDCFKDLENNDSTRMVIVGRGLSKEEITFFKNKLFFKPQFSTIAYDAIAIIVNIKAKDSVFTLSDIKDLLSGKKGKTIIMDGNNATSSVRFLRDSLLMGAPFGKNVVGVKGNDAVIDAVIKKEDAIGFVGLNWVGNVNEPKQKDDLKKIRLALVECVKCTEKNFFAKPSQASITFGEYPLARPVYYILKENAAALGTGFVNFLSLERGQLIFRRSGLAPGKMDFRARATKITE